MDRHCSNCGTWMESFDIKYKLYNSKETYWLCVDCKEHEDIELHLFGIECEMIQYEGE